MTEHITETDAWALFRKTTAECGGFTTTQNLMNAAIQQYLDKLKSSLPSLPEPNVPEGDWFERDTYIKEYAQYYAIHSVKQLKDNLVTEYQAELARLNSKNRQLHIQLQSLQFDVEQYLQAEAAKLGIADQPMTKALLNTLKVQGGYE